MIVELISSAMIIAGAALLLIGVIGLALTGDDGGAGAAVTSDDKNKGGAHECENQSTGA